MVKFEQNQRKCVKYWDSGDDESSPTTSILNNNL